MPSCIMTIELLKFYFMWYLMSYVSIQLETHEDFNVDLA